jgi:hypothetical protein
MHQKRHMRDSLGGITACQTSTSTFLDCVVRPKLSVSPGTRPSPTRPWTKQGRSCRCCCLLEGRELWQNHTKGLRHYREIFGALRSQRGRQRSQGRDGGGASTPLPMIDDLIMKWLDHVHTFSELRGQSRPASTASPDVAFARAFVQRCTAWIPSS